VNEQKFWFISSSPVWPDDGIFEGIDPAVPVFFSTREKAEAERRDWNEGEWEDMLFGEGEALAEQFEEEVPPKPPNLEVFAMEAWLLAEHLRDSDIPLVKLDDEVISKDDFLADTSRIDLLRWTGAMWSSENSIHPNLRDTVLSGLV
jgi:hypothetical protein